MPNVEIKARCADLERARRVSVQLGAARQGSERQVDTFFNVPAGRLKLRESTRTGASLIPYIRPDSRIPERSDYTVLPVEDPQRLKSLLAAMLGISTVVTKEREVFLLDNVRVHLDRVEDLGDFLEFEAVYADDTEAGHRRERHRVEDLIAAYDIAVDDLVGVAYADLLRARPGTAG